MGLDCGLAVVALIAFVVIAGWNNSSNTASNSPNASPMASGSPPVRTGPPTTTGSGLTSPQPATPAPAPNAGGAQQ
ncbi:MAG: hypothetical protein WDN48_13915 [Pseudolabrys sp.]